MKEQVKSSSNSDLHNCPGKSDNHANRSQNEVKAGKSQWAGAKLANRKIHLIYNS